MKYPYSIDYIEIGPQRKVPVMRLPEEIELGTTFLGSDVQLSNADFFLSAIDRVQRGEALSLEVRGNVCALEIKKDFTRVIDTLADDGLGNACTLETAELRKLILIWSVVPWDLGSPQDSQ